MYHSGTQRHGSAARRTTRPLGERARPRILALARVQLLDSLPLRQHADYLPQLKWIAWWAISPRRGSKRGVALKMGETLAFMFDPRLPSR